MIVPVLFALAALWIKKSAESCTPDNCDCGCGGSVGSASSSSIFAPKLKVEITGDEGTLVISDTKVRPMLPFAGSPPREIAPPAPPALNEFRYPDGSVVKVPPGSPLPDGIGTGSISPGLGGKECFPEMCLPNWGGGMTWWERYGFPRSDCCA